MEQSPAWETNSHNYVEISLDSMEPDRPMPCSQQPATAPYSGLEKSTALPGIRSTLWLQFHKSLYVLNGLFPLEFPTNILYAFLIFSLIWQT
jgi:hypothetical protein